MINRALLNEWLASRPKCVKGLADEFPINAKIKVNGRELYVIGWTEDDQLIVSPFSMEQDYDRAVESKVYVCADHLRLRKNSRDEMADFYRRIRRQDKKLATLFWKRVKSVEKQLLNDVLSGTIPR